MVPRSTSRDQKKDRNKKQGRDPQMEFFHAFYYRQLGYKPAGELWEIVPNMLQNRLNWGSWAPVSSWLRAAVLGLLTLQGCSVHMQEGFGSPESLWSKNHRCLKSETLWLAHCSYLGQLMTGERWSEGICARAPVGWDDQPQERHRVARTSGRSRLACIPSSPCLAFGLGILWLCTICGEKMSQVGLSGFPVMFLIPRVYKS